MSDINREDRKKETQEYFTQHRELDEILGHWTDEEILRNETFLDNSCGSGNILNAVLERKLSVGITLEDAIPTLFGVDFEITNVEECRTRLIKCNENLRHTVNRQIIAADGLRYHYRFDDSHPYDDEVDANKKEELFNSLFK
jgi:hypothetical protein